MATGNGYAAIHTGILLRLVIEKVAIFFSQKMGENRRKCHYTDPESFPPAS
jgi:hypothetical protein